MTTPAYSLLDFYSHKLKKQWQTLKTKLPDAKGSLEAFKNETIFVYASLGVRYNTTVRVGDPYFEYL